jgi:hypothetical protein
MELRIKFVHHEGKDCGICHIHKVIGTELVKIGEIKFDDAVDKKWIIRSMTEDHPNVSCIE